MFLSEERCEYLTQYSRVLKSIVIGYEKADLEFNQLKDKALVDKMTGVIIGKYFTIQVIHGSTLTSDYDPLILPNHIVK